MPASLWNPVDRQTLFDRLDRLTDTAQPAWGSMSASRMLAHLADAVRMATGELPVAPRTTPLGVWPINVLVMFYLPWPKGAPTAPELLRRSSESVAAGVGELKNLLGEASIRGVAASWARHPAFGALTYEQWGRLIHRHTDHHLTQFGV